MDGEAHSVEPAAEARPGHAGHRLDQAGADNDLVWTPLGELTEPGAYVCRNSGDLIRVPGSGPSSGDPELIAKHEAEPMWVTRISPDPFVRISTARVAAANLDLEISF